MTDSVNPLKNHAVSLLTLAIGFGVFMAANMVNPTWLETVLNVVGTGILLTALWRIYVLEIYLFAKQWSFWHK